MTLASDRQAFAHALKDVQGVKAAYPYPPASYNKGDAFPALSSLDSDQFDSGSMTWTVTVVLGQDMRAAEMLLDDMLPSLRRQLRPLMTLTRMTIGTMAVERGQVFVVQQQGIREYDAPDA